MTTTTGRYTPGPWKASSPDGAYHDVIRIYATGNDIPVAVCPQVQSAALSVLSGCTNDTTEAAFNAALISAAPDPLAACVEFIRKCECGEARSVRSYAQTKAAIEKAGVL